MLWHNLYVSTSKLEMALTKASVGVIWQVGHTFHKGKFTQKERPVYDFTSSTEYILVHVIILVLLVVSFWPVLIVLIASANDQAFKEHWSATSKIIILLWDAL